jgi:hypothetical protein
VVCVCLQNVRQQTKLFKAPDQFATVHQQIEAVGKKEKYAKFLFYLVSHYLRNYCFLKCLVLISNDACADVGHNPTIYEGRVACSQLQSDHSYSCSICC